jgi:hypothetical protein
MRCYFVQMLRSDHYKCSGKTSHKPSGLVDAFLGPRPGQVQISNLCCIKGLSLEDAPRGDGKARSLGP